MLQGLPSRLLRQINFSARLTQNLSTGVPNITRQLSQSHHFTSQYLDALLKKNNQPFLAPRILNDEMLFKLLPTDDMDPDADFSKYNSYVEFTIKQSLIRTLAEKGDRAVIVVILGEDHKPGFERIKPKDSRYITLYEDHCNNKSPQANVQYQKIKEFMDKQGYLERFHELIILRE